MKCKTPDCETTMSEGAPDYCPKCQAGKCEACKGSGSLWHGDPPAAFEAECHFCGGTGQKSETLLCYVCDGEMTRRQGKVICISCDMDYRRVKSELVVCDDLKNEWFKSSEFYEEQRDRYRTALEDIVELRQFISKGGGETAREMAVIARDALAGRAAGAGVGSDAPTAEKETNAKLIERPDGAPELEPACEAASMQRLARRSTDKSGAPDAASAGSGGVGGDSKTNKPI